MSRVSYREYNNDKNAFFKKHKSDFDVDTSSLDKYGRYSKTYCFADGAVWYEVMSVVYEDYEVEVKGVKINGTAKLFRTEYFSSDDANSKFVYEKY